MNELLGVFDTLIRLGPRRAARHAYILAVLGWTKLRLKASERRMARIARRIHACRCHGVGGDA